MTDQNPVAPKRKPAPIIIDRQMTPAAAAVARAIVCLVALAALILLKFPS